MDFTCSDLSDVSSVGLPLSDDEDLALPSDVDLASDAAHGNDIDDPELPSSINDEDEIMDGHVLPMGVDHDLDVPARSMALGDVDTVILPPDISESGSDIDDGCPGSPIEVSPFLDPNVAFHHDLCEYYSPPRLVPFAVARGLVASISADLKTGVDFSDTDISSQSLQHLEHCMLTF